MARNTGSINTGAGRARGAGVLLDYSARVLAAYANICMAVHFQSSVWGKCCMCRVIHRPAWLSTAVQDADVVGADFLGQAMIQVDSILDGQVHDLWLDLTDATGATLQGKSLTG